MATSRTPGSSPGTLVHIGERKSDKTEIRVVRYDASSLSETEASSPRDSHAWAGEEGNAWISVTGLHEVDRIGEVLETFSIHPLIQEDVLDTKHYPKIEDHGDYLFVVLREITVDSDGVVSIDHFSLILTKQVIVTFQEAPSDTLNPVLKRLKAGKGVIRKRGLDYLAWAILDAVVDHYFMALDSLESMGERLDQEVSHRLDNDFAREIHMYRTQVTDIFRMIRPTREAVSALQHCDSPLIDERNHVYFSDLYDHAVHAVTMTEMLRESVSSLRDFHMTAVSNRANEIMKVLTTFATIFLPLTFIAGVYGMNFKHMPELEVPWAYPAVWAIFVVGALSMVAFFKWRRWL